MDNYIHHHRIDLIGYELEAHFPDIWTVKNKLFVGDHLMGVYFVSRMKKQVAPYHFTPGQDMGSVQEMLETFLSLVVNFRAVQQYISDGSPLELFEILAFINDTSGVSRISLFPEKGMIEHFRKPPAGSFRMETVVKTFRSFGIGNIPYIDSTVDNICIRRHGALPSPVDLSIQVCSRPEDHRHQNIKSHTHARSKINIYRKTDTKPAARSISRRFFIEIDSVFIPNH